MTAGEIPTIAVLPFDNLGGDPEQTYFSDGLSEDLITALSRFRDLIVLALLGVSLCVGLVVLR